MDLEFFYQLSLLPFSTSPSSISLESGRPISVWEIFILLFYFIPFIYGNLKWWRNRMVDDDSLQNPKISRNAHANPDSRNNRKAKLKIQPSLTRVWETRDRLPLLPIGLKITWQMDGQFSQILKSYHISSPTHTLTGIQIKPIHPAPYSTIYIPHQPNLFILCVLTDFNHTCT